MKTGGGFRYGGMTHAENAFAFMIFKFEIQFLCLSILASDLLFAIII